MYTEVKDQQSWILKAYGEPRGVSASDHLTAYLLSKTTFTGIVGKIMLCVTFEKKNDNWKFRIFLMSIIMFEPDFFCQCIFSMTNWNLLNILNSSVRCVRYCILTKWSTIIILKAEGVLLSVPLSDYLTAYILNKRWNNIYRHRRKNECGLWKKI